MALDDFSDFLLCLDIEDYKLMFVDGRSIVHAFIGDPKEMLKIKQNDTAPLLRAELRDSKNESVYLTGNNPIKFILREKLYYDADIAKEDLIVLNSTQVAVSPQDSNRGRFQYIWQAEDTKYPGTYIGEFEILLNGTESNFFGPFVLADNMTLLIATDQGFPQTFTFVTADFADITQATAQEVADVINDTITDGQAIVTDGGQRLLLQSTTKTLGGSLQVTGGTANDILGFTTELIPNRKISLPNQGILVNIFEDLDAR